MSIVPIGDAVAGYDFRLLSPLLNRGTGGSALDLTNNGAVQTLLTGYTFDGSDWLEEADNADLDFTAAQVGTIYYCGTVTSATTFQILVGKRNTTSSTPGAAAGWLMHVTTGGAIQGRLSDGTNTPVNPISGTGIANNTPFVGCLRIGATQTTAFLNGVPGTALTKPVGSLANSLTMDVGRLTGIPSLFHTGIGRFVAIYREEHTDAEVAATSAWMLNPIALDRGPRTLELSAPTRTLALSVPTRTLELTA